MSDEARTRYAYASKKGLIVVVVIVVVVIATVVDLLTILENLGQTDKLTNKHTRQCL